MASFFCSAFKVSGPIIGWVTTIGLLGSVVAIESARADGASSLNDIGGAAPSDPFSSRGDNNSGIMQMIHRVMQGDGNLDRAELRASQKENVNEATSDFFTKQRERLKAAASASPTPGFPATPIVITAPLVTPVAVPPVEAPAPPAPAK
jgi:hypothetical protein